MAGIMQKRRFLEERAGLVCVLLTGYCALACSGCLTNGTHEILLRLPWCSSSFLEKSAFAVIVDCWRWLVLRCCVPVVRDVLFAETVVSIGAALHAKMFSDSQFRVEVEN